MARSKNTNKPEWTGMPNQESALKEIKSGILATHESFRVIDNEREQLTDIFQDLNAKYGIPKRIFNKLAKFSYYGNSNEEFNKNAEVQDAWDAIDKI